MDFLKFSLALPLSLGACGILGDEVTLEQKLESDTYITTANSRNHAADTELRISKSATLEERALLRLPTSDENGSTEIDLEDAFDDNFDFFFLGTAIQSTLYGCPKETLITPENLMSSVLEIDVTANAAGSLTGQLEAVVVAKPWWQNVSWKTAHAFSEKGNWETAGGDVDADYTPIVPTVSGTTLTIDLTAYLKVLMVKEKPRHYGFMLRASNDTLGAVKIAAVQNAAYILTPRLVSTYDATGCRADYESDSARTFTQYLGR